MSTITVADVPLDSGSPAQRLRRMAAAVRVNFTWWGVHRTLNAQQKEGGGSNYGADVRFLTAGKKIIDIRHEAYPSSRPCARASATTGARSRCPMSSRAYV